MRNVLIRTPRPQTVIEGKRLNQSPGGTSGWVSSQPAKDLSAWASMLRSAIRWSRCPKKRPWDVFALDLWHQEPALKPSVICVINFADVALVLLLAKRWARWPSSSGDMGSATSLILRPTAWAARLIERKVMEVF